MVTAPRVACRDADKVSVRTAEVLSNVAGLELLQAPGVSFIIPKEYRSLPQLKGEPAMCPVSAGFWLVSLCLIVKGQSVLRGAVLTSGVFVFWELAPVRQVSGLLPQLSAARPWTAGRAVVDLTVERAASTQGFVLNSGGGPQRLAHMQLTVDG